MPKPSRLYVTVVPAETAARMPCRMVVPGVVAPDEPCHVMVQPPLWLPMSSAFLPATKYFGAVLGSGSTPNLFFSSTCDLRTASRATSRCAALPTDDVQLRSVNGCSNSPSSNFLVRIRRLASSMRDIGTWPFCTSPRSVEMNCCQAVGTMTISMPALIAWLTSAAVKPGWPSIWSMPFQSDTTNPEKPSSPLSSVVMRYWLPWSFTPFQLLYEIITAPTPRRTASWNGGRWVARSSVSVIWVSPWSVPLVVPPSPM